MTRKSALNQVAKTSNNGQADSSDVQEALTKLSSVSLVGASREDQVAYWKNRLKLAERAHDLVETERSADGLIAVKGLSATDLEYGLSRKEWAAEMQLDFDTAYAVTKKMQLPRLSPEDRLLRLALLAELAGRSARLYEEEFLKIAHDRKKAIAIRAKLVRDSRHPIAEIHRQGHELEQSPAIYAPLALEIFARTQDSAFAEKALKVHGVAQEPAGRTLSRYLFMRDFARLQATISAQRIRSASETLLQKTLTERIKLIGQVEDFAGRAVRAGDWTMQLATLTALAREDMRIHDEILRIPVPRRLRGRDRATYIALVGGKALPYKEKRDQIEAKLAGFWSDSRALEDAAREYESARPELRPLLAKDIQAIAHAAPVPIARRLREAISRNGQDLTRDLALARRGVRSQPFDARSLQRLRLLEDRGGHDPMVAYLDARILQLKAGDRP